MMASPQPVITALSAYWHSAALRAAVEHRVFDVLADAPISADELARRAELAPRGTRGLLHALVAAGLVERTGDGYVNSDSANTFLVSSSPAFLGDLVRVYVDAMPLWADFPRTVATGDPIVAFEELETHPAWEAMVTGIAPLAVPAARQVAAMLGSTTRTLDILDAGGGAGVFAEVLTAAVDCRVVQVDRPAINRLASRRLAQRPGSERFCAVDGDLLTFDFGEASYDVAIYSQVAHGYGGDENVAILRRIKRALRSHGRLMLLDFVLDSDGVGHPFALALSCNLLATSKTGGVWTRDELVGWMLEAGFAHVEEHETPSPARLWIATAAPDASAIDESRDGSGTVA